MRCRLYVLELLADQRLHLCAFEVGSARLAYRRVRRMGRVGTDLGLKQADVAATGLHPTPQASQPTGGARIYPTPSSAL